ncbi:hypothetical protein KOR34_32690 [Posidoniimonas corsicana]|uniref:Legionella pneumophila major outer membrane protein n=1 Tax=Posidoniimonas corsicana TaxID=1938618 RepID=A0A5C5V6K5_9BACT|nr:BBP7 family outer membrane beta-barrel protein [Posidoniimonas corsicana]TWT33437.1 hypothetical protein KOR34_32690 [Posidoniimonas corsicana]
MTQARGAARAALLLSLLMTPVAMGQGGATPYPWSDYYAPSRVEQGYAASVPADSSAGCGPAVDPASCYPTADCTSCACPAPPTAVWSLSVGGLYLSRDHGNNYSFSYDDPNEELQYLNQREADFGWSPGFEARLARCDACCNTGMELLYWQLFPSDEQATVLASDLAGNLSAILNYNQLDYNGVTADNFTNNAFAHRLRRDMSVYNVEWNQGLVLTDPSRCGVAVSSLVGFRLFSFDESLLFASDPNDADFTGEADELTYDIDVSNLLIGAQLGGSVVRPMTGRFSLTAVAKAGVYGNFSESTSRIGGAAGTATINNGAFNGVEWLVSNDKTDVAMLAEMALGVAFQPTYRWRLTADYRLVGVSGVALPTNQIYHDLRGINDVQLLQTNGHAILHGGYVGAECSF